MAPGRSDDRGCVDVGVRLGAKPDIEVERRQGHDGVRCVEMGVGDAGWIGTDGRRWRGGGRGRRRLGGARLWWWLAPAVGGGPMASLGAGGGSAALRVGLAVVALRRPRRRVAARGSARAAP